MHPVLPFLHIYRLKPVCPLQPVIGIDDLKDVYHYCKADHRNVYKRNTVHEKLQYGCDKRDGGKKDQRQGRDKRQTVSVLYDHGKLRKHHDQRNDIADNEPGRSLIYIVFIKGIIQTGKLGQDKKYASQPDQVIAKDSPSRLMFDSPFICHHVLDVEIQCEENRKGEKEHHKITEPDHDKACPAHIPPVDIGIAVKHEQEASADLHCGHDQLPVFFHGV